MNKKRRICCIVWCVLLLTGIGFAGDKVKYPNRKQVVFVFSCKIEPSPNTEFFAEYNSDYKKNNDAKDGISMKVRYDGAGSSSEVYQEDLQRGGFSMITCTLPSGRKRTLEIGTIQYTFANLEWFHIRLPIKAEVTVPDDVRFVYLGDFLCKCRLPFYDIIDVERIDNFDEAADAVEEVYGGDAELVRLPLRSINNE